MAETELRPTPRNKLLGMIADVLSAASSPQRTQQMQGISQMLGIPALAKTANTLSYGGSLTSGKGMTTQMTPETKDALSVLLENIPVPSGKAAVAASGIIVPAMAAGAKRSEIKLAEQLIKAGQAADAYKQFRIYADPTTGQMLKVIPDTEAKFAPGMIDATAYPGLNGPALPSGANLQSAQYSTAVPLSDLLVHPDLYKASPDTAGVDVAKSIGKGFGAYYPQVNEAAHLTPGVLSPSGNIALGQTLSSGSVNNNPIQQLLSNLLHEVQHNVQYWFDMPGGGTPDQFLADAARVGQAKAELGKVDKSKVATGWAESVLKDVEKEAFRRYEHIPGEVQARLVQKQFETGDYTTHPYELMKAMGVDLNALQSASAYAPLVDLSPTVQNILDVYAPKGVKP